MTDPLAELSRGLADLTVVDERRLRGRLDAVLHAASAGHQVAGRTAAERRLLHDFEAARQRVAARRAGVPTVRYPSDLPVAEARDEIAAAVRDNQVVIVAGDTGSGKTTQLPKICLELGRGVRGMIGHTQPRRLAARTVAERVAEELDTPLGEAVGYTVRFTDRVGESTLVKVMTDGILLAEIHRDRLLERYDTLIVDEAHERSLNIDFILGYVKRLLARRADLKVVVTSATIDTVRFARHFDDAPVVEVSGRTYPVEVRYRPVEDAEDPGRDQIQAICDAVGELCREGPGDVLVFLSGEREIRDTADAVRELELVGTEVLPLYARLSADEQHRVFRPHSGRRIVLATNVAETSLTVPGIRYVVDPGTARISRYSRRTKVQRLPIEPVSRASADQRAGRCGRLGPGVCIRLYSEEDFAGRPEFTEPEILRTNLASVILQMAAVGLGDMASFPFVDPPDARAVRDGVALLEELGAFAPGGGGGSGGRRLTGLGRDLAQLPVDPRLGRMILEAGNQGCLREVLVIASGLSIQDPRERPTGQEQAASESHARFAEPGSDLLGYLRLWGYLQERQAQLSSGQFRRLCRTEYLNYLRVREWQDVHGQLRLVARGLGIVPNRQPAAADRVHRAMLSGLLSHIGMWDPSRREYRGARNARFSVAPGSVLFRHSARWVMAAELVETNRLWARDVARIRPEWAEQLGGHLVKRSHSGPWWDPGRGVAVAEERVTLLGLPLVAARRVGFGRLDPVEARRMFVRHALVEGDWDSEPPVVRDNRKLIDELRAVEGRARRHDAVIDDDGIFALYDGLIPDDVVSGAEFERWRRRRASGPDLLEFTPAMLLRPGGTEIDLGDFPDEWRHGDLVLPLSYRFEPGSDDDGVTVDIPLAALNQITSDGFDWQVPGLREELVTACIRGLPKPVRRHLVPAGDHARAVLERAGPEHGRLVDVLRSELARMSGVEVPAEVWQPERLPSHLLMRFRVVDAGGATVAAGRDLEELKRGLRVPLESALAGATGLAGRSGCTDWEFGRIEPVVESTVAGATARGYPALIDEGESVGLRVLPTPDEQSQAMRSGTRRLLLLAAPGAGADLQRALDRRTLLALAAAPGSTTTEVLDDCLACAVDAIVAGEGGVAWDEEGFARLRAAVRRALPRRAAVVARGVAAVLESARKVLERAGRLRAPALQAALDDVRAQVADLLAPGFATSAGPERLADLTRYLAAAERRLDKVAEDPLRDRQRMGTVRRLEEDLTRVGASLPAARREEARRVGWMLQELRVSLWAQVLGTPYPVSEARVRRELDRLGQPPAGSGAAPRR